MEKIKECTLVKRILLHTPNHERVFGLAVIIRVAQGIVIKLAIQLILYTGETTWFSGVM
jgi:hypothetical protein